MPALFPPSATRIARGILLLGVVLLLATPVIAMVWVRTPWALGERARVAQVMTFDHRIHVHGERIDCRYCHSDAERSSIAGMPSTQKCVPCHTQLWLSSTDFTPVRRSLATGRPIPWRRVTQLPDFVYFNHSIHVQKGVGCETCHGRVDLMGQVQQTAPLTMGWCLSCHRDPAPELRPIQAMTVMGWTPTPAGDSSGRALAVYYHVRRLTNCTACHR